MLLQIIAHLVVLQPEASGGLFLVSPGLLQDA